MKRAAVLSRPKERRAFQRFGAAITMWRTSAREVLMSGPANTGKSRACLEKLHFCADKYAGMRGLIVRKTRKSLTQSAMVTYEQKVLPQAWLGNLIRFNTTDQQYEYPNGSIIAVAGLDDPQKVMSSEWDMIYVQEATELNVADWEALTIRLRNHVMPYQQLIADCNPSAPTHWLKQRCDAHVTRMLESRHEDNPACTAEDIAALDKLTGVRKDRYRHGRWAAAEGMVYEEWDRNVHLVSMQQLKGWHVYHADGSLNRQKIKHVVAGVDWGFTNPGVIHVYGVDGDERLYLLREIYRTRRDIDWWLKEAQALQQEFDVEEWICDPAEPSYIKQFNGRGMYAYGAKNAIAPGISSLRSRLRLAPDGRPRFCVYEYALLERDELLVNDKKKKPYCLEGEMNEYVWPRAADGKPLKEVPVDENNHACDVARYVSARYDSGVTDIGTLDSGLAQTLRNYRGY